MSAPHGVLINHDFNTKFELDGKFFWVSRPDVRLRTPQRKPQHVGMVGTRFCFFLRFVGMKSTSRDFNVYTFVDEVGNHFVAFANHIAAVDTGLEVEKHTCYVVKATIKRHATDTYNPGNHDQNHINRVVVLKTIGKKE